MPCTELRVRAFCAAAFGLSFACAGPPSTPADAASPIDAASHEDATSPADAATSPADAASTPCDGDGDGFSRAGADCPSRLPRDCNDADPNVYPGFAVCRDGRLNGCGVGADIATAFGIGEYGEIGIGTTSVDATAVYGDVLVGSVASNAWGVTTRGVTARRGGGGWTVTLLPFEPRSAAIDLDLREPGPMSVGSGAVSPFTTSLAIARVDGTAGLLDVSAPLAREIVTAPSGALIRAIDILGTPTPTLVMVTRDGCCGSRRLVFASAGGAHQLVLPSLPDVTPWIAAAGEIALVGDPGTRSVFAATTASSAANEIVLDGNVIGRGTIVDLDASYLALVPTAAGLRAIRFPRCVGASDCAAAGVVVPVFALPSAEDPHVAIASLRYMGLLAIARPRPPRSRASSSRSCAPTP